VKFRLDDCYLRERTPEYVVVKSALDMDMLECLAQSLKKKRLQLAKMKIDGGSSDDERKTRKCYYTAYWITIRCSVIVFLTERRTANRKISLGRYMVQLIHV